MAASTPREMLDDFFAKFNAGDIEGVLAHYESDAAFVDEPAKWFTERTLSASP